MTNKVASDADCFLVDIIKVRKRHKLLLYLNNLWLTFLMSFNFKKSFQPQVIWFQFDQKLYFLQRAFIFLNLLIFDKIVAYRFDWLSRFTCEKLHWVVSFVYTYRSVVCGVAGVVPDRLMCETLDPGQDLILLRLPFELLHATLVLTDLSGLVTTQRQDKQLVLLL